MKVANAGNISMRNDNPNNIVFKLDNLTPLKIKEKANTFY